jgi:glycosyltransferase involved in cell wall biosynthesis
MSARAAAPKPLVSAIIATHNRATVLRRALESVYAQEGAGRQFDIEVIVVDDASTDATPEGMRQFYPSARYIRLAKNRGASEARNFGLAASQGRFVAFLDDDDVWLAHKLRAQLPVLERHAAAAMVYSQVYYSSRNRASKSYPELSRARSGWVFESLLMGNFMTLHSVLVRREAFDETGYFDEQLSSHEDWDMWLRLSFHFPFLFLPGVVAVYNVSPDGLWLGVPRDVEEEACTHVIEKALQVLPDSPAYMQLKRTARARVALAYAPTWAKELAVLHAHPSIARHNWAQRYVSRWVCKQALKTESPISIARELCAQVKSAIPDSGLRTRWWVGKMLAEVWAEIARSLAGSEAREQDAAYAATYAVAQLPSYIMQMSLARIIVRGVLSRFSARLATFKTSRAKPSRALDRAIQAKRGTPDA